MSTDKKIEVAIFELIPMSKVGSGFVREDTKDLPAEQQIRLLHPKNRVIMNTSVVKQESKENPGVMVNVVTRAIYGQEEIIKENQDKANMSTSIRDKVVFINGLRIVSNDGAFVGQFKWMKSHAQNETNPNRPVDAHGNPTLPPVFREVRAEKTAHDKNLTDLYGAQAMGIILKLVKQKGDGFEYQDEAIASLCSIFGVVYDTPAQGVAALMALAKAKPLTFIELAKTGEQTVSIEIKHALQLKLIKIEGSTIIYTEGESPMIKKFANTANTEEKKLAGLGSYFLKEEGKEAYELFKAKLSEAKVSATA